MFYIAVVAFTVLSAIAGCSVHRIPGTISGMHKFSEGRLEIDKYVREQEEGFERLKSDINNDNLQKGIDRRTAVSRYSCPVYCKPDIDGSGEVCLYRRPTEYFTSNVIFLYFDSEQRLDSWEVMSEQE